MNVLYYNPGRSIAGRRLLKAVKSESVVDVEVYRFLAPFCERLRQPLQDKTVAVVLAPTEKDLLDLYFIKHLFLQGAPDSTFA